MTETSKRIIEAAEKELRFLHEWHPRRIEKQIQEIQENLEGFVSGTQKVLQPDGAWKTEPLTREQFAADVAERIAGLRETQRRIRETPFVFDFEDPYTDVRNYLLGLYADSQSELRVPTADGSWEAVPVDFLSFYDSVEYAQIEEPLDALVEVVCSGTATEADLANYVLQGGVLES